MTDKRNFEIIVDAELPGTPERVWEAVTAGTPAWMFPTDEWPAVRTVDEYPAHLVSRMDGPEGWFNQLEHVLEPLDGGRARLHYVHSGIFSEDWDQQYDGASKHTEFYLHTLGQYLKYFDGRPVVFTDVQAPPSSAAPDGFDRLRKALGVEGTAPGRTVELELDGVGTLSAEVDFANGNFLGLRTADTLYRFFGRNAFGAPVGMTVHDFSAGKDSAATAKAWGGFLEKVYA
ncbi:SRPBCC family protein [Arthrobacter sp. H16F315]|uniref:SRPBCC family protein n=1 Tax=Arthrobacter sp. H16F315 TaxID=2955314 RepID=UPI00209762B6|nr:SRPBCC domain-containing protein [Arthrobacter sp. H16F315]MDD1475752.1 SRPBCC domain-containing protein [Arthrobacter sp. H16F315]